ncbi:MAG: cadherin-like beta sandwich domain-containing protein [Oscillospiraceae bacterium]|nr:cadherin-like beta sandwich domain-containing protein [Oscillospiraceae bacterium]
MKNTLKWLFALSCLMLCLCLLPMGASAADANSDGYCDEEVAALCAIIDASSLSGSVDKSDPASWSFVNWNDAAEKTVYMLDLYGVSLNLPDGKLDLSPFPNLETVDCMDTDITSIDVSQNPLLEYLDISGTGISALELSGNPALRELSCSDTPITSLDVSANTALVSLYVNRTQINAIDVTHNPLLVYLEISGTGISSVDLSQNPELMYFRADSSGLVSLDVSHNPKLVSLVLYQAESLTSVDVSQNPDLTYLDLDYSGIASIDVSHNPLLTYLGVSGTEVTVIDVTNNPQLCELFAMETGITALDVTHNPELYYLELGGTGITSLDVTKNPKLSILYLSNTGITALDVTKNPELMVLSVSETGLTALDVTKNPELNELQIHRTGIASIDVSHNPLLTYLYANDAPLTALDVTHNPELVYLDIANSPISVLDLTANTNLMDLYCSSDITVKTPDGHSLTLTAPAGGDLWIILERYDGKEIVTMNSIEPVNTVLDAWTGVPADFADNRFTLTGDVTVGYTTKLDPLSALKSLAVKDHTLSPAFAPDVLNYTLEVENSVTSVEIIAEAEYDIESVVISGTGNKNLNVGENVFTVKVDYLVEYRQGRSEVYCSREYTVTVIRAAAEGAPKTGDDSRLALWAALLTVSSCTAAALLFTGKRRAGR